MVLLREPAGRNLNPVFFSFWFHILHLDFQICLFRLRLPPVRLTSLCALSNCTTPFHLAASGGLTSMPLQYAATDCFINTVTIHRLYSFFFSQFLSSVPARFACCSRQFTADDSISIDLSSSFRRIHWASAFCVRLSIERVLDMDIELGLLCRRQRNSRLRSTK